jgi:hypothetical protein
MHKSSNCHSTGIALNIKQHTTHKYTHNTASRAIICAVTSVQVDATNAKHHIEMMTVFATQVLY